MCPSADASSLAGHETQSLAVDNISFEMTQGNLCQVTQAGHVQARAKAIVSPQSQCPASVVRAR